MTDNNKLKVLHYKSNFLNYSETFIKRLIEHHKQFVPAAMCITKKKTVRACEIFEAPQTGLNGLKNTLCFHLNWCLPFYNNVIKKVNPALVHAHFGFDGYRMIKPTKKANIPLIVSFYGSDVSRLPSEFDWKRRYRKLAEHGDAFIAASTHMKDQLINLGFSEQKTEVVRFGLDMNKFWFEKNYSSDLPIMMVGRMVEKKGFLYALKTIKMLKDRAIFVRLNLFGDGILRNHLEKVSQKWKIDHLVTFRGQQPIHKVRQAYHNHSLLLVPSITADDGDTEGMPNTVLEGMASGIPVIGTSHSAVPEVISHQETGFLVQEKDSKAVSKIIRLIKSQKIDVSNIRRNARRHIEQHYEINRMAEQIESIYCNVLTERVNS